MVCIFICRRGKSRGSGNLVGHEHLDAQAPPCRHSSRLSGLGEQCGTKRLGGPCRSWPEPVLTSDTPRLVPLIFQKASCGFYGFLLQINGVKDYKHLLGDKRWQLFLVRGFPCNSESPIKHPDYQKLNTLSFAVALF